MVLSFTYAEASLTQRSPEWIASHVRALEYFGGTPSLLVPDQLRSGVTVPGWYEPVVQRTYDEMAQHYGAAVMPARATPSAGQAEGGVGVQV